MLGETERGIRTLALDFRIRSVKILVGDCFVASLLAMTARGTYCESLNFDCYPLPAERRTQNVERFFNPP
jgi:hypothetical protein